MNRLRQRSNEVASHLSRMKRLNSARLESRQVEFRSMAVSSNR